MNLFQIYLEQIKNPNFFTDKQIGYKKHRKYNYKVTQFTYLSREWNNEII